MRLHKTLSVPGVVILYILRMLTTDKTCERLSEERQQLVHLGKSVRLPRVALQHGPAGRHIQSGCINRIHSGVLFSQSGGKKKF